MLNKPWYEWIQSIDRRIIYLAVFVVVSIPFFIPIPLPMEANEPVRNLYNKVEEIAEYNKTAKKKKVIFLQMDWAPAVQAECWPQTEAMIEHCMKRDIPFIIMGWWAEGPMLAQAVAEKRAKVHGKKYGEAWVNFGFKPMNLPAFLGFIGDLYSQIREDINNTPIRNVPMMKNVETIRDVELIFQVTGGGNPGAFIQYWQPETGAAVSVGVTAIIGPDMYPYLDSGQLVGMMEGLSGAAQYERLIARTGGRGARGMGSQNLAHFWILAMMILGNVGYIFQRRWERKEKQQLELAGE